MVGLRKVHTFEHMKLRPATLENRVRGRMAERGGPFSFLLEARAVPRVCRALKSTKENKSGTCSVQREAESSEARSQIEGKIWPALLASICYSSFLGNYPFVESSGRHQSATGSRRQFSHQRPI